MKRNLLWPLFVLTAIALATFPGAQALAEDWGTIDLANTGVEPGSFGTATLTNVTAWGWCCNETATVYYYVYSGDLRLDCRGLKARTTYRVGPISTLDDTSAPEYFSFTTSARGDGGTAGTVWVHGATWVWTSDDPWGSDPPNLYWHWFDSEGYGFSVARKAGKQWIDSLTGRFPDPNPPPPLPPGF